MDAFGKIPHYDDRGIRRRALVAIGRVDYGDFTSITPRMTGIKILGASSDHTILDVEDVKDRIKVGDIWNSMSLCRACLTNTQSVQIVCRGEDLV